jgi:hypothetical protein
MLIDLKRLLLYRVRDGQKVMWLDKSAAGGFLLDLSLTFYSKSVLAASLPKALIFNYHAAIASKSVRLGTFLSGTK